MVKFFKTPYFFRWILPRRIWGFNSSKSIYLTFDDGPTPELTSWILNLLQEKGIKATFFCVGVNVQSHPELAHKILSDGHVLGNHTMRHENATSTSLGDYLASIEEARKQIDTKLFRPPYGRLPMFYASKIAVNYKIVMWSWLSYDYDSSISIDKILKKADKQIKPGDILVLHDNAKIEKRTKELLPRFIDLLMEKGYNFDVISA